MKSKSNKHRKDHPQKPPCPTPPAARSRRGFLTVGAGVLLAAAGTWALLEFVIWNTTPPELVGKWVVVEGPQDGATFDFYRNGTMVGHVNVDGKEGVVNATIRVDGDQIHATTRHRATGQALTRVQTIQKLTRKSLVLRDEQGELLVMERAE